MARSRLLVVFAIVACLVATTQASLAPPVSPNDQGPQHHESGGDMRTACQSDVQDLCHDAVTDGPLAVLHCLAQNAQSLTSECSAALQGASSRHSGHGDAPHDGLHGDRPHGGRPHGGPNGKLGGRPHGGPNGKHGGRPHGGPHGKHGGRPHGGPNGKHCGRPHGGPNGKHCGRPHGGPHGKHGGRPHGGPHGKHGGRPHGDPMMATMRACSNDATTLCAQAPVRPPFQLLHCLRSNADKLSDTCSAALKKLPTPSPAVVKVLETCQKQAKSVCPAPKGQGHQQPGRALRGDHHANRRHAGPPPHGPAPLLHCLVDNLASLTGDCASAVSALPSKPTTPPAPPASGSDEVPPPAVPVEAPVDAPTGDDANEDADEDAGVEIITAVHDYIDSLFDDGDDEDDMPPFALGEDGPMDEEDMGDEDMDEGEMDEDEMDEDEFGDEMEEDEYDEDEYDEDDEDERRGPPFMVIGAAAGGLLALIAIVAVVVVLRRRRAQPARNGFTQIGMVEASNTPTVQGTPVSFA